VNNSLININLWKEQRNMARKPEYNFNHTNDQMEYLKLCLKKNVFLKYRCKLHLQACIINSETEKYSNYNLPLKIQGIRKPLDMLEKLLNSPANLSLTAC